MISIVPGLNRLHYTISWRIRWCGSEPLRSARFRPKGWEFCLKRKVFVSLFWKSRSWSWCFLAIRLARLESSYSSMVKSKHSHFMRAIVKNKDQWRDTPTVINAILRNFRKTLIVTLTHMNILIQSIMFEIVVQYWHELHELL